MAIWGFYSTHYTTILEWISLSFSQRVSIKITINILWIFTHMHDSALCFFLLKKAFERMKGAKKEKPFSSPHFLLLICNHIDFIQITAFTFITTIATIFIVSVTIKSIVIDMWKLIRINECGNIWISVRFIIVTVVEISALFGREEIKT